MKTSLQLIAISMILPSLCLAANLTATWDSNPPPEGVTSYDFQWELNGTLGTAVSVQETGSGLSQTLADAAPGTYRARVRAVNSAGPGAWAWSADSVTVLDLPSAPQSIIITIGF